MKRDSFVSHIEHRLCSTWRWQLELGNYFCHQCLGAEQTLSYMTSSQPMSPCCLRCTGVWCHHTGLPLHHPPPSFWWIWSAWPHETDIQRAENHALSGADQSFLCIEWRSGCWSESTMNLFPKGVFKRHFFFKRDFFPSILKIILNNFSNFFHLNQIKRTNWEIWFLTSATCWTMLMMENQLGVICSSSRLTMDSTRLMGLKTASWWFPKQWKIFRIIILRCWEGVRWLSPSSSLG